MKKFGDHFTAPEGKCPASGLFSFGHFFLLALSFLGLRWALNHTLALPYETLRQIIRVLAVVLLALEGIKIYFKRVKEHSTSKYDSWIPLYYCSIAMYAAVLSGFGSGVWQRMGDVFLAVGALIGGICFLLYPSSSIMIYPWTHFLSLHSFFYHTTMTYLGILVNRSGLLNLAWQHFPFYAAFFGFFCAIAYWLNRKYDLNLMFISKPFHGTFQDRVYKIVGKGFTAVLILVQMIVPFVVILLFKQYTLLLSRPSWYPAI